MKKKDIKFITFSIVVLTIAMVFWRAHRSKKISGVSSPVVPNVKLKRSTASDPNSVKSSIKEQPKMPGPPETISITAKKESEPTTRTLTLDEEIAALPTVKYKRFIPPNPITGFIGFATATRKLTRNLSKSVPEQPPLDAQSVAEYTKAFERLYQETHIEFITDYPYLSNTETGELLRQYYRLESGAFGPQNNQADDLKYKIRQQLFGSSRDTFDEILRSADRASEHENIEWTFMRLVYDLNINKSDKIFYFNLIINRKNQPTNILRAQEFLKDLSQEED